MDGGSVSTQNRIKILLAWILMQKRNLDLVDLNVFIEYWIRLNLIKVGGGLNISFV